MIILILSIIILSSWTVIAYLFISNKDKPEVVSEPEHNHDWKLISKTYFSGNSFRPLTANNSDMLQMWIESLKDKTSYLFQCADPSCCQLMTKSLDGKEI